MPKRAASESVHSDSSTLVKDESSSPPPITPKKAKKSPSANGSGSSSKKPSPSSGLPGTSAATPKGRFMEMIFETGLKGLDKKDVQDQTGLTPNQQKDMTRKDKGPLRKAIAGLIADL